MKKKMSKPDKAMLIAVIVIAVLAGGFLLNKQSLKPLAILDIKSHLKSEYNTYWADTTYGSWNTAQNNPPPSSPNFYKLGLFDCGTTGDGQTFTNDYRIGAVAGGSRSVGSISCTSTKDFKGQEVIAIFGGSRSGQFTGFTVSSDGIEKILLFKPHTLNPNIYDIYYNDFIVPIKKDVDFSSGLKPSYSASGDFSGGGVVEIFYMGSKALFSCDLSQNERWIQTQWLGSVSMEDIVKKDGFIPTKFCKETRPFVLRDVQQGETAIFPDPIPDFNKGKTIISPSSNQFIVVNYAVYQVQGLENPTTGTQAYKCLQRDSNYKCLGWVIEEVIKPVEVVVQCKVDSDCPLPLTDFQNKECLDYFKGCQNSKCLYDNTILNAPKCQNQVVTIVKQIQEVDKRTVVPITGVNIFTFSQNSQRTSFDIGDKTFTATPSQYLCEVPTDADFLNAPSPSSDCWQTIITYGGKSYTLKDTQIIKPHELIQIQYFAGGKLTRGSYNRPEDWSNTFIFTINTADALKLNIEDSGFVIKDSQKKINLILTNNLPSGEIILKIQQKVKIINLNLPEQVISKNINSGDNHFSIDMNTQNPDINTITIQMFYKIKADAEILLPSDKFILNYDIITELPSVTKVVEVERIVEKPIIKEIIKERIPALVWWIIVIVILFLIGIFIRKRYGD